MASGTEPIFQEELLLSSEMLPDFPITAGASIDRGGSLTKLLIVQRSKDDGIHLQCLTYLNADFDAALTVLQAAAPSLDPAVVHITGMGARAREEKVVQAVGSAVRVELVNEISCQALGAFLLLRRGIRPSDFLYPGSEQEPNSPFMLLFAGSGVSVVEVNTEGGFQRIGGTPFGGTVLLGLSQALFGHSDYKKLMEQAAVGNGDQVNTKVRDLVAEENGGEYSFLNPDFILYPFGKLATGLSREEIEKEALANATVHLIAMQIAFEITRTARTRGSLPVYLSGNVLRHEHFRREIENVLATSPGARNPEPRFFRTGHVGAVGALIATPKKEKEPSKKPE